MWDETKEKNIENILKGIDTLSTIDAEAEIAAHREIVIYNT